MEQIPNDPTAILESITDAFIALNTQWQFTYANAKAEQTLDRERSYLLGKTIWKEYPGLAGTEFESLFRDVMQNQVQRTITSYFSDYRRWYEVHAYPARHGMSVYFRDVTARVQANEALRESEQRFRLMADAIPQIVWIIDASGRGVYFNKQWSAYTGVDLSSISPEEVSETFVHPDDDAVTMQAWDAARREGRVFSVEHRIRSASGEYRWFLVRAEPYRDPRTGDIVQWFGTSTDVHDRKMAEAALRTSEKRYRSLFESIDQGFCIIDVMFDQDGKAYDYRFVEINPAFERQTGLHEAQGKSIRELVPQIEEHWSEIFGHVARTGAPIQFENEAKALHRWFDVNAFRIDEPGRHKVAILFKDITDRKEAQETVRRAGLHDPLTGLPNRAMLFEYAGHVLAQHRRASQSAAVLFIDLDRFKPINDTHGHGAGDIVLKDVAHRLGHSLRAGDMVARLGGDEFLILLQDIKNAGYAVEVTRHVIEKIYAPYHVGELTLSLSASVGISIFPQDGEDIDALISHADTAMYQAKQAGRNNFQFYFAKFAAQARQQLAIEQQLKTALRNDDFHLLYQPVLDIVTGEVVSVEALLRWRHAEIGPERFVPVAEATGLINPIGHWLRAEASRQYKTWIGHGLPAIPIAVNVSIVEFRDKNFVNRLNQTIGTHEIDASALQLELTEMSVMDDIDYAATVLLQLKELGVQTVLDDFGTGYSSLAYLARLPLTKIKIDKSFVSHVESDTASMAVTDAMIALGRTLNLQVVAEGIETENILDYIRLHGCTQAQGFYLGKPMAGDDFEPWYWRHRKKLGDGEIKAGKYH
jgi:diguanylate cyclase (GGDEF)-like protein/PAS domain S-box-containing protein